MPRKRPREEFELDPSFLESGPVLDDGALKTIRSMWEFASLMQYIHIFGTAVKIDEDLEIEDLERACVQPSEAYKLADIGLALLKYVSSHRGLTPELFDEYTRRQCVARRSRHNPFGDDDEPRHFADFDVATKLRVLQQMSTWTLGNAERIRAGMSEKESEQTIWRIEPFGWDSNDNTYYVLDDNRLYKQCEVHVEQTPPPQPKKVKAKAKSKAKSKGSRSSKRQKLEHDVDAEDEDMPASPAAEVQDSISVGEQHPHEKLVGTWSCIAATYDQYTAFLESIQKSRDPNEKALHKAILQNVMPQLERRVEEQRQKAIRKQREHQVLQRMATAKRSSRIATKVDKQREIEELEMAERKRLADLEMAHKEQAKQKHVEEARQSRMLTREQRLREREVNRILHEEELAKIEERRLRGEDVDARRSDRQLQTEMERRQKELELIRDQEDEWTFDCAVCGVHGQNIDDGTHCIACDKCNIWQHSHCHGIALADAERDDFHFVCSDCKHKEEFANKPRLPSLKLRQSASLSSPDGGANDSADNSVIHHDVGETNGIASIPAFMNVAATSDGQGAMSNSQQSNGHHHTQEPTTDVKQTQGEMPSAPTPMQLHKEAHSSAVASSNIPPVAASFADGQLELGTSSVPRRAEQTPNGHGHAADLPSADTRYHNQPPPVSSPAKGMHSGNAVLQSPANMLALSSPAAAVFSPDDQGYNDRAAGHSPVKQPSSPPHQPAPTTVGIGSPVALVASPINFGAKVAATPTQSMFRASTHLTSSPLPNLGPGHLIPVKQDTPRQSSPDDMGKMAVLPPVMALSPSSTEGGKGMGTAGGYGGLGTGTVPMKKAAGQDFDAIDDITMHDI